MLIEHCKNLDILNKDIEIVTGQVYYGVPIDYSIEHQINYENYIPLNNINQVKEQIKSTIEFKVDVLRKNIDKYTSNRKNDRTTHTFNELFTIAKIFNESKLYYRNKFYDVYFNHSNEFAEINFVDNDIKINYSLKTYILDKDLNEFTDIEYRIWNNIDSASKELLNYEHYNSIDSIFNLNPFPLDDLQFLMDIMDIRINDAKRIYQLEGQLVNYEY